MTKEQSNELNTIAQYLVDNFLAWDLAEAKKHILKIYNINAQTTKEEAEYAINDLKKTYYDKGGV